jgi:hypothetical protein
LFFASIQLALTVLMEQGQRQWRDPEYSRKLSGLQRRLAEEPDRPLLLMLGSSRTMMGFQADYLTGIPAAQGQPYLAFNFGLPAAGTLREWQCLRRLLDAGIRPEFLLVEVLPPLLNEPGPGRLSEEDWLHVPGLAVADVALLRHYYQRPAHLFRSWLRSRLLPCSAFRGNILADLAPSWLPARQSPIPAAAMDRAGWLPMERDSCSEGERRSRRDSVRSQYSGAFHDFHLGDGPRRALTDLLRLCRRENIRTFLVLMPEDTEFRSWYSAVMRSDLHDFLGQLGRAYDTDLLDARAWVADTDFWDGHHLLPRGAAVFSRRLDAEVISRLRRDGNPGEAK